VVLVVYPYRPLRPITAAGRVRALLYTLAKKGALDFYVIQFISYLPKQGRGSLRALRLPPPLKLIVMI
jgi:hypothetical protein